MLHFLGIVLVGPHAFRPPQGLVRLLQRHRGMSNYLGGLLRLRIGGTGVLQRHGDCPLYSRLPAGYRPPGASPDSTSYVPEYLYSLGALRGACPYAPWNGRP